ncbi:hypothetical protein AKO1_015651 [Acrasis kona]|uniref:DUF4281 domain-containing protein n=1 Tax=Acrasis kona TaxID=1008807 RepID=A0AAW2ZIH0_9EUKA
MFADNESLNTLFKVINNLPLPLWLMMMVLPSWRVTQFLARSRIIPIIVCAAYATFFILKTASGDVMDMKSFLTLDGVKAIFAEKDVVLIGWAHFIAYDIFVGSWVFLDNYDNGRKVPHLLMVVCLFFCLMLGPVGAVLYVIFKLLIAREWIYKTEANEKQKQQ